MTVPRAIALTALALLAVSGGLALVLGRALRALDEADRSTRPYDLGAHDMSTDQQDQDQIGRTPARPAEENTAAARVAARARFRGLFAVDAPDYVPVPDRRPRSWHQPRP